MIKLTNKPAHKHIAIPTKLKKWIIFINPNWFQMNILTITMQSTKYGFQSLFSRRWNKFEQV